VWNDVIEKKMDKKMIELTTAAEQHTTLQKLMVNNKLFFIGVITYT